MQTMEIKETDSKRITSLRYILMVLVIILHSDPSFLYTFDKPEWYNIIISLIKIIADASVPIFILFSGYLQGCKDYKYTILLRKRFFSLVIPYLLWSLLAILFYQSFKFLASNISFFSNFMTSKENLSYKWNTMDYFKSLTYYFNDRPLKNPFVQQFWFIRDLFIYIVISPILKPLIKKIPMLYFGVLLFLYIFNINIYFTVSTRLFFYYSIGLFFGFKGYSFFDLSDRYSYIEYLGLFILFWLSSYFLNFNLDVLLTLVIVLIFLKSTSLLISNELVYSKLESLSKYSFFIFSIHMPFVTDIIMKLNYKLFSHNPFSMLLQYFINILLVTFITTTIGYLLKKIFPKVYKILCGSR